MALLTSGSVGMERCLWKMGMLRSVSVVLTGSDLLMYNLHYTQCWGYELIDLSSCLIGSAMIFNFKNIVATFFAVLLCVQPASGAYSIDVSSN